MRHEVRGRLVTSRVVVAIVAGVSTLLAVASASAVPTAANMQVGILVGSRPDYSRPPMIPNGGTAQVAVLNFIAGFAVNNAGPDVATVKAQFELPAGLRFGANKTEPSEDCTEALPTVCQVALGNSPAGAAPGVSLRLECSRRYAWELHAQGAGRRVVDVRPGCG